jgi:ParB-like chromosome segregation protein Spo0J
MPPKEPSIVTLKIDELQMNHFVRRKLDEGHVKHLQALVESGVELDPIEVTEETKTVVDGRHRIQVYRNLGVRTVRAKVIGELDVPDLLARALKANKGGSLPPNNDDLTYVIDQMMDAGVPKKHIGDLLNFFPTGMVRKYLQWCEANRQKRKVRAAVAAVADGDLSAKQAADKYGIDLAAIKAVLSGKEKKQSDARQVAASIERSFRSASQQLRHQMQAVLDAHLDGMMATKDAMVVIQQARKAAHRMSVNVKSYEERLEAQAVKNQVANEKALRPRLVRPEARVQ